jgi:hypothetical protein
VPEMPKLVWSLENRMEWSVVSKAALRPSETSNEGWLLSAAWYMLRRLSR